jgi:transposase-like protein
MGNNKMSTKRKIYSAEFKAKLVLEVLNGEKTINEIASHYEVLPASLKNWKKQFLANMSLAFDKSAVVKEYKTEIETLQRDKDLIAKKLGETIVEKEFLEGKLEISLNKQCKLLNISKSTLYYEPVQKFSSDYDIKYSK